MSRPTDLVQGTLALLLLKLLALQPMHGWAVGMHLKTLSGDDLQVSEASLYQALHKLEQDGWITGEWKPSANNRRAKFYSLTRAGRRRLAEETGEWDRLSAAIGRVMRLRAIDT
jgi:transcriptional regulator